MSHSPAITFQLRPFRADDADAFAAAVRDSARSLSEWLHWPPAQYAADDALAWFAACDQARQAGSAEEYGIFEQGSGQLLGGAGIHGIDRQHRCAALGYWVRRTHQWRGIATQAAFLLSREAFSAHALQRLELVVGEHNLASRRVAEKLVARFEGMAANRLCIQGRQQAAAIYSLTPQDGTRPL
jgi:RimJ/RimL family protein N-acetyltransferase